jgi:hypothetical protein
MRRPYLAALVFLLGISLCFGETAPAPQNVAASHKAVPAGDANAMHGIIAVQLSRSIDSKRLKEGEEIDARTVVALRSGSGILIPSDSKVIGHVTEAKARSKGDPESSLGIVFDKIQVSGGKDFPINGVIQAVAPNPKAISGPDTGAAGSGTLAKMDGTNSATMPNPGWGPGPSIGENPGDRRVGTVLNPHSVGVVGLKNLELEHNSVLTSSNKEVKLDMGSQILIKAE